MKAGDKVKLISFNGTLEAEDGCEDAENYWKLIDSTGTIVQHPGEKNLYASFAKEKRVCVQFDTDVTSLDLHCHNKVSNALWIQLQDLKLLA